MLAESGAVCASDATLISTISSSKKTTQNLTKSIENLSSYATTSSHGHDHAHDVNDVNDGKRQCLSHVNTNMNVAVAATPKQPRSCLIATPLLLKSKSFDLSSSSSSSTSSMLLQAQTRPATSADAPALTSLGQQLAVCNSFVLVTCRDALNDDKDEFDDDDDDDNDDCDFLELDLTHAMDDDTDAETTTTTTTTTTAEPTRDDPYLKCYARLIDRLDKLMATTTAINGGEPNSDLPLYCMKIVVLFGQLGQFRPDYWTRVHCACERELRHVYAHIKCTLHTVRKLIDCLFESVEKRLHSAAKSKHELITLELLKLLACHGEYMLLTSSNALLGRDDYSLNKMDKKWLVAYVHGVDKQFERFARHQVDAAALSFRPFVACVHKFARFLRSQLGEHKRVELVMSNDMLIDYCNYLLQTHYRVVNMLKLIKSQEQLGAEAKRVRAQLDDKIVRFAYDVLTDTLSKNSTCFFFCDDTTTETLKYWNDLFTSTFKELKASVRAKASL